MVLGVLPSETKKRCDFGVCPHTAPHYTTLHHTTPHCTTLHHTAGKLRGKFARQYSIEIGSGGGRCEGLKRKGAPQLAFGLDYEQEVANSWDEDFDVTCYLPELEAGQCASTPTLLFDRGVMLHAPLNG
jgi:hypothetical protein